MKTAPPNPAQDFRCRRRPYDVLASVSVAAFLLAGCMSEPEVRGGVGVGADAVGNPVAIVSMCGARTHEIDLVSLNKDVSGTGVIGEWHSDEGAPDDVTIPLKAPPSGWAVTTPLPQLLDGVKYQLSAGAGPPGEPRTGSVEFTVADLKRLKPNEVWMSPDRKPDDPPVAMDISKFHSIACQYAGGAN